MQGNNSQTGYNSRTSQGTSETYGVVVTAETTLDSHTKTFSDLAAYFELHYLEPAEYVGLTNLPLSQSGAGTPHSQAVTFPTPDSNSHPD